MADAAAKEPVATGARERPKREVKAVDTFKIEEKEVKEFTIAAGAGTKLGDIENVKILIDKHPASSEELKKFHAVCFGRPGKQTEVKKNLREFSGFTLDGAELEKKKASVSKLDGKMIKTLLALCDQPTSGTKAENVEALVAFLQEPAESGKKSLALKSGEKRARSEKKAKGKGKKAKDELKRPPSGYLLYCNNKREKVKQENPDASATDMMKILAEKWKGISDERRQKYEAEAAALKAEYDKKKAALKAALGGGSSGPAKKKQKF
ncbi:protein dek [Chrysochromulina tobinii]|uniref:Protein dek n=1 Tax=Chrysochromulina tobinii TaxID=1460289 RepID=A0A0M0JQX1_9EUKA|nr:protein dek [Chrysochromulina tobinii]|eukprot:KOO28658.1 protein dek [Chrysochromulina sp. CCMP291]